MRVKHRTLTKKDIQEEFSNIVSYHFSDEEKSDEDFVKEVIEDLTRTFIKIHQDSEFDNNNEFEDFLYMTFEDFFNDDETGWDRFGNWSGSNPEDEPYHAYPDERNY